MKFKFFINNEVAFECPINSARCIAHNANGTRCKRRVCIGTPYCFSHLPIYLHLKIMPSTIPQAGKGVKDCSHLIKQKKIMKLYLKKVL